ncbi:MAG: hypothetical protein C4K47_03070 [Candidatus Thorarchaeota archaeon]|nr:MAG: hypothetical protein C4K47_03070 [Candidatus Thorarchaeota archaeon]
MSAFESLGPEISRFLSDHGIGSPTPIQELAIPAILHDRSDALLLAPTGSGKTEAALLPLLRILKERQSQSELYGIYILYITPLRALNRDVLLRIESLCNRLGLSVAVRHGDTTQYVRRQQALNPPNLLITTPESLQAILPAQRLRYHLRTVFAVVVDEIHEMADSKRGTQLSLGLQRLDRIAGTRTQRIGLSATVGNPKDVASLLAGTGRQVKILWAGYELRKMNLRVEMPVPNAEDQETSRRISYPLNSTARLRRIIELISSHGSTILFTNTRSFAEVLGAKMHAIGPPFDFDVHHGSLSKDARMTAETRLKQGLSRAIIATSSLELGIDIGHADLVLQYSSPREVSRALQRTGRAGHRLGMVAEGVFIATMNLDDVTESGVILRRAQLNKVEDARIPIKAWDVLCHQIAGILLDVGGADVDSVLRFIRSTQPYAEMTLEEMNSLLHFMTEKKIVSTNGSRVNGTRATRLFYYDHLSTIPDIRQLSALDMTTRTPIGVLDEDYVTENIQAGSLFVIRGRPWTVVSVDEDEVICAPASGSDSEAPHWIGEMIPVPYEVASEVSELWQHVLEGTEDEVKLWLQSRYGIAGSPQEFIIRTVRESSEALGCLPSLESLLVEDFGTGLVIHVPLGTRANETLGIVVAALLTTCMGIDVSVERDPYRILLTATGRLDPERVVDILRGYDGKQASSILRLAVKHTQSFSSRFVHVARRMGVIRRETRTKDVPIRRLIASLEDSPVFQEAMREILQEKLDEERVIDLFNDISEGLIDIRIVTTTKPSPLARLIVEEKTRFEILGEITDESEVLRLVENRLNARQLRLVCMANGDWDSVRTISTLSDAIECPKCGSRMIAVISPSESTLTAIMKMKRKGKTLSNDEMNQYSAAVLTAELVSTYGKSALMVLAAHGIGPRTASRILQSGSTDRLALLREIVRAEREYARTRPFWQ